MYDVVVIGAGPAGLSAALASKQRGMHCVVLEKSSVASTIRDYPLGKAIFSDASDVELELGTFTTAHKPSREEVLHYYQGFAERVLAGQVHTETAVLGIQKRSADFLVQTSQGDYTARFVVVAVGGMGTINTVGVPGEEDAGLAYQYQEIRLHRGERALVIGAGNSAAEVVCDLHQEGAEVTWAVRRPSLDLTIGSRATPLHPSVRGPVESLLTRQLVKVIFDAHILRFEGKRAVISAASLTQTVDYDCGFALLGRRPDHGLVQRTGALCDADGYPIYDPQTGETSAAGLFVVGHCTREINLKNAVTRPRYTIEAIERRMRGAVATPQILVSTMPAEEGAPHQVSTLSEGDENPLAWVLADAGALAVGLADYKTEQSLAYASHDSSALYEQLIIQNSAVIRAKLTALAGLQIADSIEDIVITTQNQLHVMRVVQAKESQFLVMILDRGHANLALARHRLHEIETQLCKTPTDDHLRRSSYATSHLSPRESPGH